MSNSNVSYRFYYLRDRKRCKLTVDIDDVLVKNDDFSINEQKSVEKASNFLRQHILSASKKGTPIGCVAVEIDRNTNTIRYALSTFAKNKEKSFDKNMARNIAKARLSKSPDVINTTVPDSGHEITRIVMIDIVNSNNPTRAKNAAKCWLNDVNNS